MPAAPPGCAIVKQNPCGFKAEPEAEYLFICKSAVRPSRKWLPNKEI